MSKPTAVQLKHDAWLVVTAFVGAAITAYQVQPNVTSKDAIFAVVTAGVAGAITVIKSLVTNL